jgi:proline iminopeptidase
VRGTSLFVQTYGDPGQPALLYLHGGPGLGCHEFTCWQAEVLSRDLRLVAFDQRGVLRSEPLAEDEPLDEAILVEDCEALRQALGVERWALLGHSFGGRLALRYAEKYPGRASCVIFENPAWDITATERYRLPALAAMYDALGEAALARECRQLAGQPDMFADGYRGDLLAGLDARGRYWYLADQEQHGAVTAAAAKRPDPDRTHIAMDTLLNDPGLLEPLQPLLSRLRPPALLIVGAADLVTSPDQIDAFRDRVPRGQIEVFDQSGHFVQLEQAEEYAALVTRFVLSSSGQPDSAVLPTG